MSGPTRLQQLRELSVVVADTGDIDAVRRLKPVDCTTNPTLVRKALDLPAYAATMDQALDWAGGQPRSDEVVNEVADRLTIAVGAALSELVPGRVSTEVDADLAHDTAATVAKARKFIDMYAARGIGRERILIKVAATWAGVQAAAELQRAGIDCNLTLIFNRTQALACAEAGAFLISPFVGRILDWHVARGQVPASIDEDPGVVFVRGVYEAFKRRGADTVVMGASFRSTGQVEALAGCDRLTISPELLEQLDSEHGELTRKLSAPAADGVEVERIDAARFASDLAADAMADEKLAAGIAAFAADLEGLRQTIRERLESAAA